MHGGMEFMRSDIVRCAVKWYDAVLLLDTYIKSGVMGEYEVAQRRVWDAETALTDAVKRWKGAQE